MHVRPTLNRIVQELRAAVARGQSVGGAELDAGEWTALLREINSPGPAPHLVVLLDSPPELLAEPRQFYVYPQSRERVESPVVAVVGLQDAPRA